MKYFLKILFLVLLYQNLYAESFELKINIKGLKNQEGNLIVALYNKDGTIPDKNLDKYFKKIVIPATNPTNIIFSNLKQDRYAIMVIHDENKNNHIDKGFVLPKEGIGFSNLESISLLNKPNFEKTSFILDKNLTKSIKINYF